MPPAINLKEYIRSIPDFPKPGIMFRDITPLLSDAQALRETIRQLAEHYRQAHDAYLADRAALAVETGDTVPENAGFSAGGMPTRVKCLHALVGHALAAGAGVNPFGDEALKLIGEFWDGPCKTEEHCDD